MKLFFLCFLSGSLMLMGQQSVDIPPYYGVDTSLSQKLNDIVTSMELDGDFDVGEDGVEQISLGVIQLRDGTPKIGGVNMENFIYPASVYKMYVAAEVLRQISEKEYSLDSLYVVQYPNIVDTVKEILSDPRPLLKEGDTVTVNYLLDLMITRSDNTASNCLIDLAQRENINALMHRYGWHGSEVTRKFLSRSLEDPNYKEVRGTETSALHAADFLYRIEADLMVNPWVSQQMKVLLGGQLDKTKLPQGLPHTAMYYHKTGWWSTWTHDVGIVRDGEAHYIIACFLPLEEEAARPKFKELAQRVDALLRQ